MLFQNYVTHWHHFGQNKTNDKHLYKTTVKYQKKAEVDLKFLHCCEDNEVYPKFMQWKHYKQLKPKMREKHYNTILKYGISNKHKKIKNLNKDLESNQKCLHENTTWMKFILIKYSVHCLVFKENKKTVEKNEKKFTNMLRNKLKMVLWKNPTNLLQIFPGMNYHQKKSKF